MIHFSVAIFAYATETPLFLAALFFDTFYIVQKGSVVRNMHFNLTTLFINSLLGQNLERLTLKVKLEHMGVKDEG